MAVEEREQITTAMADRHCNGATNEVTAAPTETQARHSRTPPGAGGCLVFSRLPATPAAAQGETRKTRSNHLHRAEWAAECESLRMRLPSTPCALRISCGS